MKRFTSLLGTGVVLSVAALAAAQTQGTTGQGTTAQAAQPAAAARLTDVYHVHFTKAVPGQASALGDLLRTPDPKAPMPGHILVLRHQFGDDWDYCVIQHLGTSAKVDPAPTPPNPGTAMRAWHGDTFVAGPPWAEFEKAMGLGAGAASSSGSVYTVGVWRASAEGRDALQKLLSQPDPAAKVQTGLVFMQHLEGGPWQFLVVERFNSWQDFATRGQSDVTDANSAQGGWGEVRRLSTWHHDTVADRLATK